MARTSISRTMTIMSMKITTVLEIVSILLPTLMVANSRNGWFYDIFDIRKTPQRKAICYDYKNHKTYPDDPERYKNSLLPKTRW